MNLDLHYVDPRLVELYDSANGRGADTDFYLQLAADLAAKVIVDLGCGTGLLTRELAADGRQLFGIDPAAAMLAYARRQPRADRVVWIEGDSQALGQRDADLVIMTGNVAQVFLEDTAWESTLKAIYATLKPGGFIAFESRNPADRAWDRWNRDATYQISETQFGPLEEWLDGVQVRDGRVRFKAHNHFLDTGEQLTVTSELRFRSSSEITQSLVDSGFAIEHVYGDWKRGPLMETSRDMVFVARRGSGDLGMPSWQLTKC